MIFVHTVNACTFQQGGNMKWKDIKKGYKFKDGSEVTQIHQQSLYDCYKLYYDDKEIILSKDHILKINISKLPEDAQKIVRDMASKGKIPIKEDLNVFIMSDYSPTEEAFIKGYLLGEIRSLENHICTEVIDISDEFNERYSFKFKEREEEIIVVVTRNIIKYEDQKIDEENYWLPVEGIAFLYNMFGEIEI